MNDTLHQVIINVIISESIPISLDKLLYQP